MVIDGQWWFLTVADHWNTSNTKWLSFWPPLDARKIVANGHDWSTSSGQERVAVRTRSGLEKWSAAARSIGDPWWPRPWLRSVSQSHPITNFLRENQQRAGHWEVLHLSHQYTVRILIVWNPKSKRRTLKTLLWYLLEHPRVTELNGSDVKQRNPWLFHRSNGASWWRWHTRAHISLAGSTTYLGTGSPKRNDDKHNCGDLRTSWECSHPWWRSFVSRNVCVQVMRCTSLGLALTTSFFGAANRSYQRLTLQMMDAATAYRFVIFNERQPYPWS